LEIAPAALARHAFPYQNPRKYPYQTCANIHTQPEPISIPNLRKYQYQTSENIHTKPPQISIPNPPQISIPNLRNNHTKPAQISIPNLNKYPAQMLKRYSSAQSWIGAVEKCCEKIYIK
jgi:hypothetical protein